MRLLASPFETERPARAPAIARPLSGVAAAAALGAGAGLAVEAAFGSAGGMGHALAGASVHAGFLASGWVVAVDGRTGWRGPALRGAPAHTSSCLSCSRGMPAAGTALSSASAGALLAGRGRWDVSRASPAHRCLA